MKTSGNLIPEQTTAVIHKQKDKGMGHPTDAQKKVSATMKEAFVVLFWSPNH